MKLVQLFLPAFYPDKEPASLRQLLELRNELADKFGGITTYTRSPAQGLWKETEEKTVKDDIIIYEVLVERMDLFWWRTLKQRLEAEFRQDEIMIRFWDAGTV